MADSIDLSKYPGAALSERAITIRRTFKAPRELVFRSWTEPKLIVKWWGPNGFTTPHCTVDLHPEGVFHYCMRRPDGFEYWGLGKYLEIVVPERLVYSDAFSDEFGSIVPPSVYGVSEDHPIETLVTLTFEDLGHETDLTLEHTVPSSVPEQSGAVQGWCEMLDRLEALLKENVR